MLYVKQNITTSSKEWFLPVSLSKYSNSMKLFCFPYGGGAATIYFSWKEKILSSIDAFGIALPGRGARYNEPSINNLSSLIAQLYHNLTNLKINKYILFGHSFGGLVAYELAKYIQLKQQMPLPKHVIISATGAPHTLYESKELCQLDDYTLAKKLNEWGGIPNVIMKEPDLLSLFIPAIRADITMMANYIINSIVRLKCPITVFGGDKDPNLTIDNLSSWSNYTELSFSCKLFKGNHFYIFDEDYTDPLAELNRILSNYDEKF